MKKLALAALLLSSFAITGCTTLSPWSHAAKPNAQSAEELLALPEQAFDYLLYPAGHRRYFRQLLSTARLTERSQPGTDDYYRHATDLDQQINSERHLMMLTWLSAHQRFASACQHEPFTKMDKEVARRCSTLLLVIDTSELQAHNRHAQQVHAQVNFATLQAYQPSGKLRLGTMR
ncbi:hypothetical protein [Ferrimonas marina]|uniref:Uncharacterized protein n=1 Tax=Ferrimonas marina TaxID=299255 RepID=A0A1M5U675_9GAMM|nr:hypothetical protein [Ferrimonas marina]SHH58507.1 hypothetical protein SAMN02745129_2426 [Ferrimonas marina]